MGYSGRYKGLFLMKETKKYYQKSGEKTAKKVPGDDGLIADNGKTIAKCGKKLQ